MDFDYVVAPILIVIGGSIVIALVIRRLRSLRARRAAGTRQLFQRITLTAMAAIALSGAAISGVNAILLWLTRHELPGSVYVVHGRRMRINCIGEGSPTIVGVSGIFPVTYTGNFDGGLPTGAQIFGNASVEAANGANNSPYVRLNPAATSQSAWPAPGSRMCGNNRSGRTPAAFPWKNTQTAATPRSSEEERAPPPMPSAIGAQIARCRPPELG